MPPRSFKKCVIAVSGTFPGYKQAQLKAIVEGHGATFSTTVVEDCTHLITTQKEVEKNSIKYQQACNLSKCQIVSLEWLLESDKAKKPLIEKAYLVESGTSTATATATTAAPKKDAKKNGAAPKQDAAADKPEKKKRGAQQALKGDVDDDTPSPKKSKDAQKASSKALKVPVDEGYYSLCNAFVNPAVYIDQSGLIWDATLNQTNVGQNNNKFYRIQVLAEPNGRYQTWTRWGRVGETGQSANLGNGTLDDAIANFEKKFKDKSGNTWANRLDPPKAKKYTFIERNYDDDEEEEEDDKQVVKKEEKDESTLAKPIQDLMTFIFNKDNFLSAMASMSYDAKKMPLGKLSERTIKGGFGVLNELSKLVNTPALASEYGLSYGAALQDLTNRYFTTIPHVFGRNAPPLLDSLIAIKKEVELLEALTDMEAANDIMNESKNDKINELDRQFQGLGMQEMTPLDHKSTEFTELESYLHSSRGSTHHLRYSIINIFRIERQGENDRFMKSEYADRMNGDRRLLWHGSRSTNFGGILSQGLRIAPPEAPVSGYMFGKGVYFADTSSKSANYCCPYNSGNMGLLMLCDVELGDPMHELMNASYTAGEDARKLNKIATLGKGRTVPGGWKDAGCLNPALEGVKMPDVSFGQNQQSAPGLMYNEYIVYDVAQIRQRYLFHVHMS